MKSSWLVGLVLAFAALSASWAHDADVLFVSVASESSQPAELRELVTLTGATLGQLAPVDADGDGLLSDGDLAARHEAIRVGVWDEMPLTAAGVACPRREETVALREGYVELSARFHCGPGELRQDFRILRVLPTNYRVVLGSQVQGEAGRAFAQGSFTTLTVPRPPAGGQLSLAFQDAGRDGVRQVIALGPLAAVLLLVGLAASWRRGLWAWAAVALGFIAGVFVPGGVWGPSLALVLVALLAARPSGAAPGWGALLGLAVGAHGGGGGWSTSAGLAVGGLGALVVVGAVVLAAGQWVRERPRVAQVVRLAAAAATLVGVGFQVAG